MNRTYKTVYNEDTGTFVAVAENVKAKGKRSSGRVSKIKAGGMAAIATGALFMGSAMADVVIDNASETITFTGGSGTIIGVTSITGLSSLQVGGQNVVTADQIAGLDGRVTTNETDIAALDGRVTTNETEITALDGRVTTSESDIAALDGRVTDTEADITDINDSLEALGVDADNPGVKYFRANSEADDAQAIGDESIAIGPNSIAQGDSSFAAGDGAQARENNSFAAGKGAVADGTSSIALGDGATVSKPDDLSNPVAAIAIGQDSASSGAASTAIGREASASGASAIALGDGATASGGTGIALGSGALAGAANNISIGNEAGVGTTGVPAGDQTNNIAIGERTGQNVVGQRNVAMGKRAGNDVEGNDNIAIGENAGSGLLSDSSISIGRYANESDNRSVERAIGIGERAQAGTDGIAMGRGAAANGINGVAIGLNSKTQSVGVALGHDAVADSSFVALGAGSQAVSSDISAPSAVTGKVFTGSAVSVGSSEPGNTFTRRIVNVEDGANPTDAVNVNQLLTAIEDAEKFGGPIDYDELASRMDDNFAEEIENAKAKYVSVNDGGSSLGNRDNDGAGGVRSVAIGTDASTSGVDSSAIGSEVEAIGDSSVVLGHDIKALGDNTTVIGNSRTEARDESGVAIGTYVQSRGENSIVIGRDSESDDQDGNNVDNSIVIGTSSQSTAEEGIVVGKNSLVNAERGIAQGSNAETTAADAMAFGTRSRANAVNSQASGTDAVANAVGGVAVGRHAKAGQDVTLDGEANENSIAIGTSSYASMNSSIATGTDARATADFAQASGYDAQASARNSIAVGTSSRAAGSSASAFGHGAQAMAQNASAFGQGAIAQNNGALAAGSGARAQATNASALGQGAIAAHPDSVALGAGSLTAGANQTSSGIIAGITYGTYAGNAPESVVSVGSNGKERQITNVAAGRVTATSTDAINGSQLFATNTVLGNVANSLADGPDSVLGGDAQVGDDGTITMTDIGETGENTVHDAIKYAAQGWDVSANGGTSANVAPGGSVDFGNTDGNIDIALSGTDLTFNLADNLVIGNSVSINGGPIINVDGINMNDNRITNLAPGEDGTDAVNVDQLEELKDIANAGWDITDIDGNTANIGPEGIVKFEGDNNITVTQTGEDQEGVVEIALNKDVDLGEDGSLTIGDGTDGSILDAEGLIVTDGDNETMVGAGSISVTDADGTTTIGGTQVTVGGTHQITIDGDTGVISGLQNQDINYPEFADGSGRSATEEQLDQVNKAANAGWDITDIDGNTANIGPYGVVQFEGDDNITVAQTGVNQNGVIEIALKRDLDVDSVTAGNAKLNTDGLSVVDGDKATMVGAGSISVKDADGTTTIGGSQIVIGGNHSIFMNGNTGIISGLQNQNIGYAGFADGSGRAATEEQLNQVNQAANAGWNVTDADGNMANIGPNGTVTFGGDHNISVSQTGVDQNGVIEISLNKDVDLGKDGSLTIGDTLVNNDGLTVKNAAGDSTTVEAGNISVGDANGNTTVIGGTQVVVGGDKQIALDGDTGIISGLQNQDTDYAGFADGSGRAATEEQLDQVNETAKAGWNITDAEGNTANIGPNGLVTFKGDDNISVAQTGADQNGVIDIALSQDITVNSITAVDIKADRIEVNNGGPIIDEKGINMGGNTITNVAEGVNESDAVNVGQLHRATGNLQGQINDLRGDLRRQDKRLSGGVAAAMATASLPQAYLPGKTMMAIGGGTWNGETGMAIGFSGISDNGKWVYKLSGNSTSRGDYGAAVGIGYQW